jgi:hypothetical protein
MPPESGYQLRHDHLVGFDYKKEIFLDDDVPLPGAEATPELTTIDPAGFRTLSCSSLSNLSSLPVSIARRLN